MIIYQGFGPITVEINLINQLNVLCYRQSRAFTITSTVAFYEQFTRDMKMNGRRLVCRLIIPAAESFALEASLFGQIFIFRTISQPRTLSADIPAA